jgi:hypothetical protein
MHLHHSATIALLLGSLAHAESAAPAEDVAVAPAADCRHSGDKSWTLTREAKLSEILKTLADLTCERFFVPRALLGEKLTIDVGKDPMASFELHQRVEGALRSKGIVLEFAQASRVRRASTPTTPPAPSVVSMPNEALEKGIQCTANRCTLSHELVEQLRANLGLWSTSARMVPSFKDGKPAGIKVFAIRPDSVYAHLGLLNGDTLVSLDGLDLSSPEKALESYTHVKSKSRVTLEVERRGQKLTMEYILK